MKNIILVSFILMGSSFNLAYASSVRCEKQIAKAAIDKMEKSSIVDSKGSVTLEGDDAIQAEKGNSWLVGLMHDDPCYASVRVTLQEGSCTVKSAKIISHECTDN